MKKQKKPESYSHIKRWTEDFPALLPVHNRPEEGQIVEERWNWRGNDMHLDRYVNPGASLRLLLLHGVGGTGRLLSFIAAPLHRKGYDLIAPDLPGYGLSEMQENPVNYNHWLNMAADLLVKEQARDQRPFVVFGLSAGGMLAYQVTCRNPAVRGVIATNLLDQRHPEVRKHSAKYPWMASFLPPFIKAASTVMPDASIPIRKLANMEAIVNDVRMHALLMNDPYSCDNRVSMAFIETLMNPEIAIEPADFHQCPVLLVHPEKDLWTPLETSLFFFNRLPNDKRRLVILENAGHFPLEPPGLQQMEEAIETFLERLIARSPSEVQHDEIVLHAVSDGQRQHHLHG
jgi:pimeloyl-ACP methyl ester carboxylesterase